MSGSKPIYYWDSCVYIAWIKQEQIHGAEHLAAMDSLVAECFSQTNHIITSVITDIEVLEDNLPQDVAKKFTSCFRHGDHLRYDVDIRIAQKAKELRAHFRDHPYVEGDKKKKLSTPDAIHLATAIIYGCTQFHTFDEGKKESRFVGLLQLSGMECVNKMVITKPSIMAEMIVMKVPQAVEDDHPKLAFAAAAPTPAEAPAALSPPEEESTEQAPKSDSDSPLSETLRSVVEEYVQAAALSDLPVAADTKPRQMELPPMEEPKEKRAAQENTRVETPSPDSVQPGNQPPTT